MRFDLAEAGDGGDEGQHSERFVTQTYDLSSSDVGMGEDVDGDVDDAGEPSAARAAVAARAGVSEDAIHTTRDGRAVGKGGV